MLNLDKLDSKSNSYWKALGSFFRLVPEESLKKAESLLTGIFRSSYASLISLQDLNAMQSFKDTLGYIEVFNNEVSFDLRSLPKLKLEVPKNIRLVQKDPGSNSLFYTVTAINSNGETTAAKEFLVTGAGTSVEIEWDAVEGAKSYNIYGRSTRNHNFIGTSATNSFIDINTASAEDTSKTSPAENTAIKYAVLSLSNTNYFIKAPTLLDTFNKSYLHNRDYKLFNGNELHLDITLMSLSEGLNTLYINNALVLNSRIVNFYFRIFGKTALNLFSLLNNKKYLPTTPEYTLGSSISKAKAYATHLKNWAWAYSTYLRSKPTISNINKAYYIAAGLPFSYAADKVKSSSMTPVAESTYGNSSVRYGYEYGKLVRKDFAEPLIETDPNTGEFLGYKSFQGRDNLLSNDQDLTSWTESEINVTSSSEISPDLTVKTVYTLNESITTGAHSVSKSILNLTDNTDYNFSIFAKAESRTTFAMEVTNKAEETSIIGKFNLRANKTYLGKMDYLGGGWYRCSASFNAGFGASDAIVTIKTSEDASGSSMQVWGPMVSQGGFLRTFSTSTLNSDTMSATLPVIKTDNFSFIANANIPEKIVSEGSEVVVAELSDNFSATTYIRLSISKDKAVSVHIRENGGGIISVTGSIAPSNKNVNIAAQFKNGEVGLYLDGVKVNSAPYTLTQDFDSITIGHTAGNDNHLNGHIVYVGVSSELLSDNNIDSLINNQIPYALFDWIYTANEENPKACFPDRAYVSMYSGKAYALNTDTASVSNDQDVSQFSSLVTGISIDDYISDETLITNNSSSEEEERLVLVAQNNTNGGTPDSEVLEAFKTLVIPAGLTLKGF